MQTLLPIVKWSGSKRSQAKERVVRAECAEIVDKIEKRIEGDRTVRLGFVLSEIDEAMRTVPQETISV